MSGNLNFFYVSGWNSRSERDEVKYYCVDALITILNSNNTALKTTVVKYIQKAYQHILNQNPTSKTLNFLDNEIVKKLCPEGKIVKTLNPYENSKKPQLINDENDKTNYKPNFISANDLNNSINENDEFLKKLRENKRKFQQKFGKINVVSQKSKKDSEIKEKVNSEKSDDPMLAKLRQYRAKWQKITKQEPEAKQEPQVEKFMTFSELHKSLNRKSLEINSGETFFSVNRFNSAIYGNRKHYYLKPALNLQAKNGLQYDFLLITLNRKLINELKRYCAKNQVHYLTKSRKNYIAFYIEQNLTTTKNKLLKIARKWKA